MPNFTRPDLPSDAGGMGLMRRVLSLVVMLVILFGGVTACGSSSKSTQAATSTTQAASASATQSASPSSATCASAGTRKIPKTRLLADLGLTYGLFHRYLYKPYKAGSFHKGANGRTAAIIKAALASAAIIKLLSNAVENAAADPTLCKYVPNIDSIKSSLSSLTGKIKDGTATSSDVESTSNLFNQLKNGTGFTPSANPSLP
jgi:hypothetical protein